MKANNVFCFFPFDNTELYHCVVQAHSMCSHLWKLVSLSLEVGAKQ